MMSMRIVSLLMALALWSICLIPEAREETSAAPYQPPPLTTEQLKPYLKDFLQAVGEKPVGADEYSHLTRLGVGAIFVEALGQHSLNEAQLKANNGLRHAFTVLTLEFAELLWQHTVIPATPLQHQPEKAPRTHPATARLNYARLVRTWYGLGQHSGAGYPREFFTALHDAGVGASYPKPTAKLTRYDYAARMLHILLFETDAELMRDAGPGIIAASLDLFGEMRAVGAEGDITFRLLRRLYVDSLAKPDGGAN